MFDRVIAAPSSKRWSSFLMIGTAAAHAAVLTALVLVAFWKVEKLPINDNREITVSVQAELPPPGGPPPGEKLKAMKGPEEKKPPPVDVQKVTVILPAVAAPTGGSTETGKVGGNGTNIGGDPESKLVGDGECTEEPCGETPVVTVKKDPPKLPPKVTNVTPDIARGLRISGNEKIYPPDSVRVSMVHDDKSFVQGTLKVCVDTAGGIDSVSILHSTGYRDYDAVLVAEMRGWRYRPYAVDGVATPMCSVQIVIYRMKR